MFADTAVSIAYYCTLAVPDFNFEIGYPRFFFTVL